MPTPGHASGTYILYTVSAARELQLHLVHHLLLPPPFLHPALGSSFTPGHATSFPVFFVGPSAAVACLSFTAEATLSTTLLTPANSLPSPHPPPTLELPRVRCPPSTLSPRSAQAFALFEFHHQPSSPTTIKFKGISTSGCAARQPTGIVCALHIATKFKFSISFLHLADTPHSDTRTHTNTVLCVSSDRPTAVFLDPAADGVSFLFFGSEILPWDGWVQAGLKRCTCSNWA
ncbi:hypothetical protein B0H14DRAFT_3526163 [Mycena olivaceomarginata]|nr:hypothetical protein B0H14DRAFT_3526163 [Mycena olivaceomarginata]